MVRAIAVILAVMVLLGVGWFVGHRPVRFLEREVARLETEFQDRAGGLEQRALRAEARGELWRARTELLLAAADLDRSNFGLAAGRVAKARDLVTHALATPGFSMDLGEVRDMVDSALGKIEAKDPEAAGVLVRAAEELGRHLERTGQA